MHDRKQPAHDLGTAQLAQFGAVALLIVSITVIVLGHQGVIADWLAFGVGALSAIAAVAAFWRAAGWDAAAKQWAREQREADEAARE